MNELQAMHSIHGDSSVFLQQESEKEKGPWRGGGGEGSSLLRRRKKVGLDIPKVNAPSFIKFFSYPCHLLLSIQRQMKIVDRGTPNPVLSQVSKCRAFEKLFPR